MYSKNAIFAREVDAIMKMHRRKLFGRTVLETETAEVLEAMGRRRHGVAWLPECVAITGPSGVLARVDASDWSNHSGIVAYRDKNTAARRWNAFGAYCPPTSLGVFRFLGGRVVEIKWMRAARRGL